MTSVYLIKENGIMITSVSNDKNCDAIKAELESSLLTGICIGISTTFLSSIDYIVLNDRTVVYYRTFVIHKAKFVLVVSEKRSNGVVKDIGMSSKMVLVKIFLQENNRWKVLTTNEITSIYDEIKNKLHDIFLR